MVCAASCWRVSIRKTSSSKTTCATSLAKLLDKYAGKDVHAQDWDIKGLKNEIFTKFGVDIEKEGVETDKLNRQELGDAIFDKLKERYDAKEQLIGPEAMRHHERIIMLSVIDQHWKDHLLSMDHLREGIGLRGYGQHDPLVEYKRESFDMFEAMMQRFQEETVRYLYLMQVIDRGDYQRAAGGERASDEGRDGGSGGPGVPVPVGSGTAASAQPRQPPRPSMRWKKLSNAARSVNWNRRAWRAPAIKARYSRSSRATRLAATILVPAVAAKNTRSAAAHNVRRSRLNTLGSNGK